MNPTEAWHEIIRMKPRGTQEVDDTADQIGVNNKELVELLINPEVITASLYASTQAADAGLRPAVAAIVCAFKFGFLTGALYARENIAELRDDVEHPGTS